MAKCLLCNDSGWFLKTTRDGLCEPCAVAVASEVSSATRVVNQSLDIASATKKLDTMLSRLSVAENGCRQLLKYEGKGIRTTDPAPSALIEDIEAARRSGVLNWIDREMSAARAKSDAATTPAAKTRGYSKLLENISSIYSEVAFTRDLAAAETKVRKELDTLRLNIEIERAEKLEFKGQKKRACDAYLEALFLLRGDSIPDDEQQPEIDKIESKIRQLGGELPTV